MAMKNNENSSNLVSKPPLPFCDPWKLELTVEEAENAISETLPYVFYTVQQLYNNSVIRETFLDDLSDDPDGLYYEHIDLIEAEIKKIIPGDGLGVRGVRQAVWSVMEALCLGEISELNSPQASEIAYEDIFCALMIAGRWAGTHDLFENKLVVDMNDGDVESVLPYIAKHAFYLAHRLNSNQTTKEILINKNKDLGRLFTDNETNALNRCMGINLQRPSEAEKAASVAAIWIVQSYYEKEINSIDGAAAFNIVRGRVKSTLFLSRGIQMSRINASESGDAE